MTRPSKPPVETERQTQAKVCEYFKVLGIHLERHNVGKFVSQDGRRRIYVGKRGDPDYTGSFLSRRVWVEVKRPGRRPELHQVLRMMELNAKGDFAVWLDGIEHIAKIADALRSGYDVEMETTGDYSFVKKVRPNGTSQGASNDQAPPVRGVGPDGPAVRREYRDA